MSKQDVMNDIVLSPDPRLRTECTPIEEIDDSIRELAARMLEDMYAAEGCGLAAPQVGETIQLVVIDVDRGHADGVDGEETLKDLEEKLGPLPHTASPSSPTRAASRSRASRCRLSARATWWSRPATWTACCCSTRPRTT